MKKIFTGCRTAILVMLTHNVALPLLRRIRKPLPFSFTEEELAGLPAGTLGNDLHIFLRERNFKLLKHYSRHDMKHIVLGYNTTDQGEACLQCFMLGNGRISFPVLATVMYSMITMPEHWQSMKAAYKKGRQSGPVHDLPWPKLLEERTSEIQNWIRNGKRTGDKK
jgi:ubiquinone biosynthesis protein Coq4